MDDKYVATCAAHSTDKVAHKVVAFDLVNSNAVLDRYWNTHSIAHGFDAICNSLGLVHQACAKGTALHAVAGAAAVQIDFVIAILLTEFGGEG